MLLPELELVFSLAAPPRKPLPRNTKPSTGQQSRGVSKVLEQRLRDFPANLPADARVEPGEKPVSLQSSISTGFTTA